VSRAPEIAVVVPSQTDPCAWLLNALEQQTLPRERWEVVVGHDSAARRPSSSCESTAGRRGVLRHVTLRPGRRRRRQSQRRLARRPRAGHRVHRR